MHTFIAFCQLDYMNGDSELGALAYYANSLSDFMVQFELGLDERQAKASSVNVIELFDPISQQELETFIIEILSGIMGTNIDESDVSFESWRDPDNLDTLDSLFDGNDVAEFISPNPALNWKCIWCGRALPLNSLGCCRDCFAWHNN